MLAAAKRRKHGPEPERDERDDNVDPMKEDNIFDEATTPGAPLSCEDSACDEDVDPMKEDMFGEATTAGLPADRAEPITDALDFMYGDAAATASSAPPALSLMLL